MTKKNLLILICLTLATRSRADSVFGRMKQTLIDNGFEVGRIYDEGQDVPLSCNGGFVNGAAGLHIAIEGSPIATSVIKAQALDSWRHSSGGGIPHWGAPSGFSLGEQSYFDGGEGDYIEQVFCDRYQLRIEVIWKHDGAQNTQEDGNRLVRMWCERISRRMLGEAMANDLNDDGSENANAHLTGQEVNKGGMETLAVWAHARGVTVTYDAPTETASFTYHGKQVKLPLASGKAVVNGVEVALGGKFILARRAIWFVPGAELTAAIGWR